MWPDNHKCAVALTFDFDARSVWTSFGMTTPMPMSRGDYGANVGVPRILAQLKQFNIPATFFIPADTRPSGLRLAVKWFRAGLIKHFARPLEFIKTFNRSMTKMKYDH